MMAGQDYWVRMFKDRGWLSSDGKFIEKDVADVGVAFGGAAGNFLGLCYVTQIAEGYLLFEYEYQAPMIRLPWQPAHTSGKTRIFLPWESIDYVFENIG